MKALKRILTVPLTIAVVLTAIFLAGRYGWNRDGILFAAAACMFFAACNFRIAKERKDKDNMGEEADQEKQ